MTELFYRYIMTPTEFQGLKVDIINFTGLSRDALHVHIGLIVFLMLWVIFGRRRWSAPLAWLILFTATFVGEWLDYAGKHSLLAMLNADDHVHDLVNTLFWPTMILAYTFVRRRRDTLSRQSADESLK